MCTVASTLQVLPFNITSNVVTYAVLPPSYPVRELRHREVVKFVPSYTGSQWKRWGSHLPSPRLVAKYVLSFSAPHTLMCHKSPGDLVKSQILIQQV